MAKHRKMAESASASPARGWRNAIFAGLLAGTLDILFALTLWALMGVPQTTILQTIASGILGRAAFGGGLYAASMGLALHFAISLAMALAYFGLAPAWARRHALLSGPAYGLMLWFIMNFIVVPLSAAPIGSPPTIIIFADIAAHILLVGLPIAIIAQGASSAHAASCRSD